MLSGRGAGSDAGAPIQASFALEEQPAAAAPPRTSLDIATASGASAGLVLAFLAAGYAIFRSARRIPTGLPPRARPGRGRIIALSAAVPAVGLLMTAGYSYRERILEEWYLHGLGSPHESVRLAAAEKLCRFGSERSARALIAVVEREGVRSAFGLKAAQALLHLGGPGLAAFWDDRHGFGSVTLYAVVDASDDDLKASLVAPGIEALKNRDFLVRFEGASLLGRLGAAAESAIPHLEKAVGDESEVVRITASDAILRIEASLPAPAGPIPATFSPADPVTPS